MTDLETNMAIPEASEVDTRPITRRELFKEVLRYRSWDLVLASFLTALFWLPYFLWLIAASYWGLLDYANLFSVALTHGAGILFLEVASLGMAGLHYFLKKLAWGEGASLPGDFFEGISKNGKDFLGLYLIFGIVYLLLRVDIAALQGTNVFYAWAVYVFEGVSYAGFFLFLAAFLFAQAQAVIYRGSPWRFLFNGVRLSLGGGWPSFLFFLAAVLPFAVYEFVPSFYAQGAMVVFEALYYFAFSGFFLTLDAHSLFDESINRRQYPTLVRKGLRGSPVDHKEKAP